MGGVKFAKTVYGRSYFMKVVVPAVQVLRVNGIKAFLKAHPTHPVSITADGWSQKRHMHHFLGIVLSVVTFDGPEQRPVVNRFCLDFKDMNFVTLSGAVQAHALKETLACRAGIDLDNAADHDRVLELVADSASDCKKCAKELNLEHFACVSHIINNSVKDALDPNAAIRTRNRAVRRRNASKLRKHKTLVAAAKRRRSSGPPPPSPDLEPEEALLPFHLDIRARFIDTAKIVIGYFVRSLKRRYLLRVCERAREKVELIMKSSASRLEEQQEAADVERHLAPATDLELELTAEEAEPTPTTEDGDSHGQAAGAPRPGGVAAHDQLDSQAVFEFMYQHLQQVLKDADGDTDGDGTSQALTKAQLGAVQLRLFPETRFVYAADMLKSFADHFPAFLACIDIDSPTATAGSIPEPCTQLAEEVAEERSDPLIRMEDMLLSQLQQVTAFLQSVKKVVTGSSSSKKPSLAASIVLVEGLKEMCGQKDGDVSILIQLKKDFLFALEKVRVVLRRL